jgi:uncharacterized damage-inducible protein DinB
MAITQSVRDLWHANDQVNNNLLQHLTQEMMSARTPGGGMTVAEHLAEIAGAAEEWIRELGPQYMRETQPLYSIEDGRFNAFTDLELFRERLPASRDALLEGAEAVPEGEKGGVPHRNADAVLLHMIVHDSHHRGQLLLALKTNGFGLPEEAAMWKPWRNEPWP